jgi:hypothetical protein
LAWLALVVGVLLWYRRGLLALWREPVLRYPVLIVESDDWGAGPVQAQATALDRLVDVLARYKDGTGRHPVMTLAIVLAVPDGPAIRATGRYQRITLEHPLFAPVRAALDRGRRAGVFALQLHGLEHYWPAALMASPDATVRAWLEADPPATTERLPAHLQSRWTDASVLPSRPLSAEEIGQAVREEVELYARVFGERPRVVVPPTFVWTRQVERAWIQDGIGCLVTPGWRYTCRDGQGRASGDEGPIANGDSDEGLFYLARYDYFEPLRGRGTAHALAALQRAAQEGRPCLLENHRDNFIGGEENCRQSLEDVDALYRQALARHDGLRFLSTAELGTMLSDPCGDWLETRPDHHADKILARLKNTGRPWKLIRLIGLAWLLPPLLRPLARHRVRPPAASASAMRRRTQGVPEA